MTIAETVKLELTEMKKVGIRIPKRAFLYVDANASEIEEYRAQGMTISGIADLVCDLV